RQCQIAAIDKCLDRLRGGASDRRGDRLTQHPLTRETIERERYLITYPEQTTADGIDAHDTRSRVDGQDAFIQRVEQRGEQRLFFFERGHSSLQLLGQSRDGVREIANLTGCAEGGATREVAGGQRAGHVAQLDDGSGDRPREQERDRGGDREREEPDEIDVVTGLAYEGLGRDVRYASIEPVFNDPHHARH